MKWTFEILECLCGMWNWNAAIQCIKLVRCKMHSDTVCLAKTRNSQYVDLWPLMTIKNYSVWARVQLLSTLHHNMGYAQKSTMQLLIPHLER